MEALGAAAAIAQFVKLSFEASELARSVVSSFRHAPAEILELETKLQRLHCLLTQVASMCDELPEAQTRLPLLPNHHIGVLSMGMQSILDSLMRLKSVVIVPVGGSYSVGDRLRWATLDKKKARNLLQEAQMANDELSIMLQILTTRLSFLNQDSLAALNIGQSFIIRSLDDIKGMLSIDLTQLTMRSQKAELLFSMCFKLLGHHILRFELQAQLLCRLWRFDPSLRASLTIVNVRPSDTPIFEACRNWNLQEVHYLLETGQAGINDTDGETGGLLEHVISGNQEVIYEPEFLKAGQVLLEYLVDQGCDPSITHARNDKALPAVLSAFSQGYKDATSTLVSHGADIVSFGNKVGGLFEVYGTNESQILWKFRLLQSMGYTDWKLDGSANNLLYGACWSNNADVSLFALEIAGLDPNQSGFLDRKPIGNAAQRRWIEGITILLQYGADVNVNDGAWNGPPLRRSMTSGIMTDTSHFLLLKGAEPGLKSTDGLSAWGNMMARQYDPSFGWYLEFSYLAFEGSVAHLLHHGSDPFEIFISEYDIFKGPHHITWFTQMGHLQGPDIARFRSYGMSRRKDRFEGRDAFRNGLPEDLVARLEMCDRSRSFGWTFRWNKDGQISWNQSCSSPSHVEVTGSDSYVDDEESLTGSSTGSVDAYSENEGSRYDGSSPYITKEGNFVAVWEHADSRAPDRTAPYLSEYLSPSFFTNATNFYRHTATLQGQRQLSRWPMVRALCDGLQHAGYRVEMDDDGDLWYDCDDGDRYFDARTEPAEDHDNWLVDFCPICKNPEKYGLGHILNIEKEAKEKVREYRRQVSEGKWRYYF
ncbi:hypothetical protein CGGC5_v007223 [Colletotrichum fructicola Nara gc5]|uniref:Fungal N-terminal domain-containing protein n=1 Tax=Colletotrichum fructicola (strain Nara gc5) TaxID=1213859 RepID=A0A7J6J3C3_COLFN|nr:hypothetical protein CGGC5_v007223 [Colletotrichum fructicola Nara gc5]KAF4883302.1 hypothetical protein CGCFRS4_v013694 [Colletotrichum fructicola]